MKSETRGSRGGWVAFTILLIAVGAGLLLFLWQRDVLLPRLCQPLLDQERAESQRSLDILRKARPVPPAETPPVLTPAAPSEAARRWGEITGAPPTWPRDLAIPGDCDAAREDLLVLCAEVDSRPYVKAWALPGGSFALVVRACEEMAARPPVVSGELASLESFLANAFHMYRVLGARRVDMLREILVKEQALAEPAAMAVYRWLAAQERCGKEGHPIPFHALYDYAAYLLNTMGGQGYLRRRPSLVAGLAGFYSLLVLDHAIQRGMNPHGVDPRAYIPLCRDLLKAHDLVFRDRYLEILQDMERRWGVR
jgi:hypothetical protein